VLEELTVKLVLLWWFENFREGLLISTQTSISFKTRKVRYQAKLG